MAKTRRLRDLATHLRHIANLLADAEAEIGELPAGASVTVMIVPEYAGPASLLPFVDAVAKITGQPAAFDDDGGKYGMYSTRLDSQAWVLTATAHTLRPVTDLEAENARLRAQLDALQGRQVAAHA